MVKRSVTAFGGIGGEEFSHENGRIKEEFSFSPVSFLPVFQKQVKTLEWHIKKYHDGGDGGRLCLGLKQDLGV
jgi:hypothetical protein